MANAERVVVVIGIGGMGLSVARELGTGGRLLLADLDPAALHSVGSELRASGYDVVEQATDVSDPGSVSHLAATAAELGRVEVVAHTAGVSPAQASVRTILRVDLLGTAQVLDSFAGSIAPGGAGVVIASMSAWMIRLDPQLEAKLATTPTADLLDLPELAPETLDDPGLAYAIAKRGNQLRVRAAAATWGRVPARINSISPGVIATPMGAAELDGPSGEGMRQMFQGSPAGRVGTAADIAGAVSFLTGSRSTYITGTDLLVDGGVVATLLTTQQG